MFGVGFGDDPSVFFAAGKVKIVFCKIAFIRLLWTQQPHRHMGCTETLGALPVTEGSAEGPNLESFRGYAYSPSGRLLIF